MSSFELNKIFAALLVAVITVMFAGFIADRVSHASDMEKDSVSIEGSEMAGSGAVAKKPAEPELVLHLIASADTAKGKALFRACASCHSTEKGGSHRVGPNLWDVVDAPKGGKSDYGYSTAIKETGGMWGYTDLNEFLWKPKKSIPGTKMGYVGLKKPKDRAAIIAWLRTLSDSAKALPGANEIVEEAADLVAPAEAKPAH